MVSSPTRNQQNQQQQKKPHAVLLPFPAQGHVNPLMQLAKLLHSRGFYITFVNTEHNHRRLVRTRGPESVKGLPDFRFEAIPDGLPPSDKDATQDPPAISYSTQNYCLEPFLELLEKLKSRSSSSLEVPPVTCIVSDGIMTLGIKAAGLLGIKHATFWTASVCGLMGYLQFGELIRRGISPLKETDFVDGTLEMPLDWIPGMSNMRLKDLPSFVTTTDANDIMFNHLKTESENSMKSNAVIFNTFDPFEEQVLDAVRTKFPRDIYTIGPLHLLGNEMLQPEHSASSSISSNFWKEDCECTKWLDQRERGSVIYVNYGSVTVMSEEHMKEFAWGLADSKRPFLWIVRGDIAMGDSPILPPDFLHEIEGRGCLTSWCSQQEVLSHPAVGVFLTHCGWNSMMESVSAGVPMICWPFFAEQQTNCRFACCERGIGVELSHDVKRNEVVGVIEEVMSGEGKGKVMKQNALEWQRKAKEAVGAQGSSMVNFTRFVQDHSQ